MPKSAVCYKDTSAQYQSLHPNPHAWDHYSIGLIRRSHRGNKEISRCTLVHDCERVLSSKPAPTTLFLKLRQEYDEAIVGQKMEPLQHACPLIQLSCKCVPFGLDMHLFSDHCSVSWFQSSLAKQDAQSLQTNVCAMTKCLSYGTATPVIMFIMSSCHHACSD
jgi:hypothetical protein